MSAAETFYDQGMWELHVGFYVPWRNLGRKVKRVGGRYSKCYGYNDTRYVHVPNTTAGRVVVDEILACSKRWTTVIERGVLPYRDHSTPSWMSVCALRGGLGIADMCRWLHKQVEHAERRGIALVPYTSPGLFQAVSHARFVE